MSSRVEVMLWAQRVIAKKNAQPHEILEIKADASFEAAQEAFHKVARIAHPDLHRTTLDAGELEKVTTAYAYVAAAYQAVRISKLRGGGPKPETSEKPPPDGARLKRHSEPAGNIIRLPGGGVVRGGGAGSAGPTRTKPPTASTPVGAAAPAGTDKDKPRAAVPAPSPAPTGPVTEGAGINPSTAMNSKALVYYRKAEMALRQGDLRMAVLNLKMAIASDPASTFLRQALGEVDAELKAGK